MKNLKIVLLLLFFIFLSNCTGVQDVMSGNTKTTDEFLVKKRKPLILPPDYNELPKPGSNTTIEKSNEEKIIQKVNKNKT